MAVGLLNVLAGMGRGLAKVGTKGYWIKPYKVNIKTGAIGRNIEGGVPLEEARKTLKIGQNDKLIGSAKGKKNATTFFTKTSDGSIRRSTIGTDKKGNLTTTNKINDKVKAKYDEHVSNGSLNYAPVIHDTNAFTKKGVMTALGGAGTVVGGGYGVNEWLDYKKKANYREELLRRNHGNLDQDIEDAREREIKNYIKAKEKDPYPGLPDYARGGKDDAERLREIREKWAKNDAEIRETRKAAEAAARAEKAREENPEIVLPDYARSGKGQADSPMQIYKDREARRIESESVLPHYAKSGQDLLYPTQSSKVKDTSTVDPVTADESASVTPQANINVGTTDTSATGVTTANIPNKPKATPKKGNNTNIDVKSKDTSKLNYDPMADWIKTDQAINNKWNKRRENYTKMVSEGVDPYEAYNRSLQDKY